MVAALWSLFSAKDRRQLWLVVSTIVIGSVLEAAAIGLTVPFISMVTDPGRLAASAGPWLPSAWLTDPNRLAVRGAAALLVFYVVKNIFMTVTTFVQFRFVYGGQTSLSQRLFTAYLRAPWLFHVNHNSGDLLRNVNVEVPLVYNGVLLPLLTVATEGLVSVALLAVLVLVDPWASLIGLVTLGGASWLFYLFVRKRTDALGVTQQQTRGAMIRAVNEGLGAIKDTRVLGREHYFARAYARHSNDFAAANSFLATVTQLPRFFLETVAIGGVMLVLMAMSWQGRPSSDAVSLLALSALSAFRLMPAMNRVVASLANIRYHRSALDVVAKGLHELDDTVRRDEAAAFDAASAVVTTIPFSDRIELRHVQFTYQGADRAALADVALTIHKGSAVGIKGPSGAGKTTLVDVIVGLLAPTAGQLTVDGRPVVTAEDFRAWRRHLGYIPQQVALLDDSLRRNIAFGVDDAEIDDDRVWRALRSAQLEPLVRGLKDGLNTSVGERGVRFSGGERQRLGIARALYHDPDVLVLDEITSALDVDTEREVMRTIKDLRGEKTLILITHRLSTLEQCDEVFELRAGRLA